MLVVIGSAEEAYTWENPFTAGERYEMVERGCREAGLSGVAIVPVEDIRRHTMWVAYLTGLLPKFDRVYTNNPLTRLLFERSGIAVESPAWIDRERLEGSAIRARLARGEPTERDVPPAVLAFLREIGAAERLALLRPPSPSTGPSRS